VTSATSSGTGGGGGACAAETVQAQPLPLDLYIMLDSSGSMDLEIGSGNTTRWEAVTGALSSFYADPQSDGLGVALQFFPLTNAAAPSSCSSNGDCGAYGPCFLKTCSDVWKPCDTAADCDGAATCEDIGLCQVVFGSPPFTLTFTFGECVVGSSCLVGDCNQVGSSFCWGSEKCDTPSYAAPQVDWAVLPAAGTALDAAANGKSPNGGTPTAGALAGAIAGAKARALANPDRRVVAVLATDGEPTRCDPVDQAGVAQLAADGLADATSIPTFVIGVLDSADMTATNMVNAIAAAGGTTQAHLIDANGNVSMDFQTALENIKTSALDCEYQVPQPTSGTIDYGAVNVEHTPSSAMAPDTVFYVGSAANCDATAGGWYYDVDPSSATPNQILMCPATCDAFKAGGEVAIAVGCQTIVAPPK
jgi:hypothetical protein